MVNVLHRPLGRRHGLRAGLLATVALAHLLLLVALSPLLKKTSQLGPAGAAPAGLLWLVQALPPAPKQHNTIPARVTSTVLRPARRTADPLRPRPETQTPPLAIAQPLQTTLGITLLPAAPQGALAGPATTFAAATPPAAASAPPPRLNLQLPSQASQGPAWRSPSTVAPGLLPAPNRDERLAAQLGTDLRLHLEPEGDGYRVRQGANCLKVLPARESALNPWHQNAAPTPRLVTRC